MKKKLQNIDRTSMKLKWWKKSNLRRNSIAISSQSIFPKFNGISRTQSLILRRPRNLCILNVSTSLQVRASISLICRSQIQLLIQRSSINIFRCLQDVLIILLVRFEFILWIWTDFSLIENDCKCLLKQWLKEICSIILSHLIFLRIVSEQLVLKLFQK